MLKQSVSPITPSAYTTTTGKFPVTYRAHAFNVQLQSKVKKQLPPQLQQRLAMPMSAPTNTPNMLSQPGIPNPRMRQTLTNKSHNFHTPVPNGLTSFQESFALKWIHMLYTTHSLVHSLAHCSRTYTHTDVRFTPVYPHYFMRLHWYHNLCLHRSLCRKTYNPDSHFEWRPRTGRRWTSRLVDYPWVFSLCCVRVASSSCFCVYTRKLAV